MVRWPPTAPLLWGRWNTTECEDPFALPYEQGCQNLDVFHKCCYYEFEPGDRSLGSRFINFGALPGEWKRRDGVDAFPGCCYVSAGASWVECAQTAQRMGFGSFSFGSDGSCHFKVQSRSEIIGQLVADQSQLYIYDVGEALEGCDDKLWNEALFWFKLDVGRCVLDIERVNSLLKRGQKDGQWPGGCLIGRMLFVYCGFMGLADGGKEHSEHGLGMYNQAQALLDRLDRLLHPQICFALTGITQAVMRYNLMGTFKHSIDPELTSLPTLEAIGLGGNWNGLRKPILIDLGMGGGLDALVMLSLGVRIIGIEALPSSFQYLRVRLARFLDSGQLSLHHSVVISEERRRKMNGSQVFFREDTMRPDWSSVLQDTEQEERDTNMRTHRVSSTSCVAIWRQYGRPDALKIDLEGMDKTCISDLVASGAGPPRILSAEFPVDRSPQPASRLFSLLWLWGYRRFKISRQSIYQPRCWPGKLNCEGSKWDPDSVPNSATLSGLMGDAAVDFRSGQTWRTMYECLHDLSMVITLQNEPFVERFDVHAQL